MIRVSIAKRDYAHGIIPWCPYVGGFWFNLSHGFSTFCWLGFRVTINRGEALI